MSGKIAAEWGRLRSRLRGIVANRIRNPDFGSLETFCTRYSASHPADGPTTALDLGCGTVPRNPFGADTLFGIDIREDPKRNIQYADVAVEPLPFPDASFDYITAYDFLEHVPRVLYTPGRRFPFIELMNEIWRTLKPRGVLLSHTPAFPYAEAFQDPTHVNIITEETFPKYFSRGSVLVDLYGFKGAFEIVRQGWARPHLISILRKLPV